ncbi:type II toxin-antitoxin system RelE/ParE family toxin [Granulicella mallensis]|uniref:type II toxin-antitoxin system RelE/ParE family toxin n=1 Tax=Granulicella mallensis TaxID=940614 RepID=UPI001620FCB2
MYRIIFAPESRDDLRELRRYIAREASPRIAARYVDRLLVFCQGLSLAPHRGEQRISTRPEIRTIGFERRVSIAFLVSDEQKLVTILGFFYGGRSAESLARKKP